MLAAYDMGTENHKYIGNVYMNFFTKNQIYKAGNLYAYELHEYTSFVLGSKNGIEYSSSLRHLLISLYSSVSSDEENDIPDFGNSKGNDNVSYIDK